MSVWSFVFNVNWIILWVTLLLFGFYHIVLRKWTFFSDRGVKYIRGNWFVGLLYETMRGKESLSDTMKRIYDKYPQEHFVGAYNLGKPVYIIRDLDLIKKIAIQNFDHFVNHEGGLGEFSPLLSRSLILRRDQEWKNMRSTLSPVFTGNKMRQMFGLMQDTATAVCKNVKEAATHDESPDSGVFDLKELYQRTAIDIIASCAFGLKVDSLTEKDNEFFLAGKNITQFKAAQIIKIIMGSIIPTLMKKLGVQLMDKKLDEFFRDIILSTITHREKRNIQRPDMIQLLMEAKAGTLEADHADETSTSSVIGEKFLGEYLGITSLGMKITSH